jgi:hypothetical protein
LKEFASCANYCEDLAAGRRQPGDPFRRFSLDSRTGPYHTSFPASINRALVFWKMGMNMIQRQSQDKPAAKNRGQARLNEILERHLLVYAAAASAAGVGMLAGAQPAEAEIVYTPAHLVLTAHHKVSLDLNHDGISDFTISNNAFCTTDICGRTLLALPVGANNKIAGIKGLANTLYAYALKPGSQVGPNLAFSGKLMAASGTEYGTVGRWLNVTDRYLGLEFHVGGNRHFGWARFHARAGDGKITATLTGYAYETIPNKPIIAGKMNGSDEEQPTPTSLRAPTPVPATLGMLALGAPGLSVWRREESLVGGLVRSGA